MLLPLIVLSIFDSVLGKFLICFGGTFNIHNTDPRRDAFCTRFVIYGSTHTQFRKENQEINPPCSKHCMLVVIPILELGQNHYYEFTCKHLHQVHNIVLIMCHSYLAVHFIIDGYHVQTSEQWATQFLFAMVSQIHVSIVFKKS